MSTACTPKPKRDVWAVVVSIAPHSNPKWDADELIVTARSQNGVMGKKAFLTSQLSCKVGDTVHGTERGVSFKFDPTACLRPGSLPH